MDVRDDMGMMDKLGVYLSKDIFIFRNSHVS